MLSNRNLGGLCGWLLSRILISPNRNKAWPALLERLASSRSACGTCPSRWHFFCADSQCEILILPSKMAGGFWVSILRSKRLARPSIAWWMKLGILDIINNLALPENFAGIWLCSSGMKLCSLYPGPERHNKQIAKAHPIDLLQVSFAWRSWLASRQTHWFEETRMLTSSGNRWGTICD